MKHMSTAKVIKSTVYGFLFSLITHFVFWAVFILLYRNVSDIASLLSATVLMVISICVYCDVRENSVCSIAFVGGTLLTHVLLILLVNWLISLMEAHWLWPISISLGIGQGYQPVLGYNYSAKRFDRVRSAYLFTLGFSTALMTIFGIFCAIFASALMNMFSLSEEATSIGELALRLQCITMPLLPMNFMAGLTYQVVGNKAIAALLSISRQGLFYIPAVLILPSIMQLLGVQSSQAVADLCAFLYAIPFTIMFFAQ